LKPTHPSTAPTVANGVGGKRKNSPRAKGKNDPVGFVERCLFLNILIHLACTVAINAEGPVAKSGSFSGMGIDIFIYQATHTPENKATTQNIDTL